MDMLSAGEPNTLCAHEGEGGRAGRAVDISFLLHACVTARPPTHASLSSVWCLKLQVQFFSAPCEEGRDRETRIEGKT